MHHLFFSSVAAPLSYLILLLLLFFFFFFYHKLLSVCDEKDGTYQEPASLLHTINHHFCTATASPRRLDPDARQQSAVFQQFFDLHCAFGFLVRPNGFLLIVHVPFIHPVYSVDSQACHTLRIFCSQVISPPPCAHSRRTPSINPRRSRPSSLPLTLSLSLSVSVWAL